MVDNWISRKDFDSPMVHAGAYRRVVAVSLERLYEWALDWECLPYLHRRWFREVRVTHWDSRGWRGWVTSSSGAKALLEVSLNRRGGRWVARIVRGAHSGAQARARVSRLRPDGEATGWQVVVDIFVPSVDGAKARDVGSSWIESCAGIFDAAESLMIERQRRLDRRVVTARIGPDQRVLGRLSDLQLPAVIEVGGREYVIAQVRGEVLVYPAVCPHKLGPLAAAELRQGLVECPWHGYRFDVRTGECVNGHSCRISQMPRVVVENGLLVLLEP